jgi:hypothetical protein
MSSISPISIRLASKTRYFESSGDSAYYYSNQLISNLALLKTITKLGQQLSWPIAADKRKTKRSVALPKINLSVAGSRVPYLINMKSAPAREWFSANKELVGRLSTSQQFFNSKAIGLLAKTLARSNKFNASNLPHFLYLPQKKAECSEQETPQSSKPATADSWFTCFQSLSKLGLKYSDSKHKGYTLYPAKARLSQQQAPRYAFNKQYSKAPTFSKGGANIKESILNPKKSIIFKRRKDSKQAFKTPDGLPFYLTALGLVGHCQIIRSSLAIAPIISGSFQSNLLLANHAKVIKISSSNGLDLVSAKPKCYIGRNNKNTVLNLFFKIPAQLTEAAKLVKKGKNFPRNTRQQNHKIVQHNQVFILADLKGISKQSMRVKAANISIRWPYN